MFDHPFLEVGFLAALASLGAACEEQVQTPATWTLTMASDVETLDLGYLTYQDELPSVELRLDNSSGVPIVVEDIEIEGHGAEILVLSGGPEGGAAVDENGGFRLVVSVTDEVDWRTGWYESTLVVTASSAERSDEDQPAQRWELDMLLKIRCDLDGDGFDAAQCGGTDCDDESGDVNDEQADICNGLDDDCDGVLDEDPDIVWYVDSDGDGFGTDGETATACDLPSGFSATADVGDDGDASIHPDAEEYCNGTDDDCDGEIDEQPQMGLLYFADADGDGYGDSDLGVEACEVPSGMVDNNLVCDDYDATVNPDGDDPCGEEADGVDNDCDGVVDNLDRLVTYFEDADGDGYGDADVELDSCDGEPSGYVSDATDCDDGEVEASPSASEVCGDNIDNDCDGDTDCEDADCDGQLPCSVVLSDADALLIGESSGDQAGASVACVGDLDGDGYDDLLVGAPGQDGGGSNAGAAYAVFGPVTSSLDLSSADVTLWGEATTDLAGEPLAAAGDFDGDGLADLFVGAPYNDTGGADAGCAYLVLGPGTAYSELGSSDLVVVGDTADENAGAAIAGVGDTDGDGLDDLLLGAPGDDAAGADAGMVALLLGGSTGLLYASQADVLLLGEAAGDGAGGAVVAAGDLDGDGFDDLMVGAAGADSGAEDAGIVYVLYGPLDGDGSLADAAASISGVEASAGLQVGVTGDLDGDATLDFLVGVEDDDTAASAAGAVYAFLGPLEGDVSLSDADDQLYGSSASSYVGCSLAAVGDLTGDGAAEVLVGAWGAPYDSITAGSAFLLSWPWSSSAIEDSATHLGGESTNDRVGMSVASGGDIDGDTYDDLVVGAPYEDSGGSASGAVYLVLGGNFQ